MPQRPCPINPTEEYIPGFAQTSVRSNASNGETNQMSFSVSQGPNSAIYNLSQAPTGPEAFFGMTGAPDTQFFSLPPRTLHVQRVSKNSFVSPITFTPPQGATPSSPIFKDHHSVASGSPSSDLPDEGHEIYRRVRIKQDQRRRDDEREGFAILRTKLPNCPPRSSKAVLLERAAAHIDALTERNAFIEYKLRIYEELANDQLSIFTAQSSIPSTSSQSSDGLSSIYEDTNNSNRELPPF